MQKGFWERSALKNRRSASHPVVKMYSQSKLKLIFEKINTTTIENLLDVGCGNGFFTVPLEMEINNVVGLDFSNLMLSLIKKKTLSLLRGDSLFLPFKDASFDLVLSSNLLHHVDNVSVSISEMKRVTRKYIVIIEANKQNFLMYLFSKFKKEEHEQKILTKEDLKAELLKLNIKILESFSTGFITPNRTPQFLTPFLKRLNQMRTKIGLYNIVIGILD